MRTPDRMRPMRWVLALTDPRRLPPVGFSLGSNTRTVVGSGVDVRSSVNEGGRLLIGVVM